MVLDFVGTPLKYWQEGDLKEKQLVQRLIFTEDLSYDAQNRFGTPKLSLPFALNMDSNKGETCMVEMAGIEPASKEEEKKRLQS